MFRGQFNDFNEISMHIYMIYICICITNTIMKSVIRVYVKRQYSSNKITSASHKSASSKNPDSKVHGAKMGPIWVLSAPDGPHVRPMNLDIWEYICCLVGVVLSRIIVRVQLYKASFLLGKASLCSRNPNVREAVRYLTVGWLDRWAIMIN